MQNPLITFALQTLDNHQATINNTRALIQAWPGTGVQAAGMARTGGARGATASTAGNGGASTSRRRTRSRGARGANLTAAGTPTAVQRSRR